MRFHVVSLPHTHVTAAFSSCAFTQKVLRFCQMMTGLGHEVILYAGEQSEAPATEHVVCIDEAARLAIVGAKHFTEADWGHPDWQTFNARVIEEMGKRIGQQDFICLIGGWAQKPIADAFPAHISVEFGIGYAGTFARYRVFESYAWMHMIYGAQAGSADRADGQWFDAVIPNQVDPALFPDGSRGDDDYYLYVGRLIDRKGYRIAQEVCEKLGKRLILAGPGGHYGYGEFVGEVGPEERGRLMAGATALFAPTIYVEPFGTVHIEAMACGTPVISTDWGVFTETIQDGFNGYRCRTFSEFCAATEAVKGLGRGMIRRRALDRYSMVAVARQYEAYFARLGTIWGEGWYQL